MDHINCRINFVTNVVNSLAVTAPDTFPDPSTYLAPLQKDQAQLQNYTNSGDVASFRAYIKNNFDPDFRQFKISVIGQFNKTKFSPDALASIKKNFALYKAENERCAFKALNEYATEKVNVYLDIITQYQLKMFSLSSKGIDIYPLVTLLQKENSQIIIPLINVVNTVNPNFNASSELRVALNNYCLFDGCLNGINGHLAANFEATKLQIILNYMKHNTKYTDATEMLSQAQNSLNNAQSMLILIGTSSYLSPIQADEVCGNINATAKTLRSVVSIYGG